MPEGVHPSGLTALLDGSVLIEAGVEGAKGPHLMTVGSDGTIGPIHKMEASCERIVSASNGLFCSIRGYEGYTDEAGVTRGNWPGAIIRIDHAGRVIWKDETPGFNPVCAVVSGRFFCRLMPGDERAEVPFVKLRAYGADGMISEVETPPKGHFTEGSEGVGYLWYSADGHDDFITFDLASGAVLAVKDLSVLRKYTDWSINEIGWVHRFADGGFIATLLVSYPRELVSDQGDTFIAFAINADGTKARDRVAVDGYTVDHCGGLVATSLHGTRGQLRIVTDANGRALWEFVGPISYVTPMANGSLIAVAEVPATYDPKKFSKSTFKVLRIDPPAGISHCS